MQENTTKPTSICYNRWVWVFWPFHTPWNRSCVETWRYELRSPGSQLTVLLLGCPAVEPSALMWFWNGNWRITYKGQSVQWIIRLNKQKESLHHSKSSETIPQCSSDSTISNSSLETFFQRSINTIAKVNNYKQTFSNWVPRTPWVHLNISRQDHQRGQDSPAPLARLSHPLESEELFSLRSLWDSTQEHLQKTWFSFRMLKIICNSRKILETAWVSIILNYTASTQWNDEKAMKKMK